MHPEPKPVYELPSMPSPAVESGSLVKEASPAAKHINFPGYKRVMSPASEKPDHALVTALEQREHGLLVKLDAFVSRLDSAVEAWTNADQAKHDALMKLFAEHSLAEASVGASLVQSGEMAKHSAKAMNDIHEVSLSMKEIAGTVKSASEHFKDNINLMLTEFMESRRGGESGDIGPTGMDIRDRCDEIAFHLLDSFIHHGISLFDKALNRPVPNPSSSDEKDTSKQIRDFLWTGMTTLQNLSNLPPDPPQSKGSQTANLLLETEENNRSLETGKRKLAAIEEEQSSSLQDENGLKRLRSSSRTRISRGEQLE